MPHKTRIEQHKILHNCRERTESLWV